MMTHGNAGALNAYIKRENKAHKIFDEYNTVDNVHDVSTYCLTEKGWVK